MKETGQDSGPEHDPERAGGPFASVRSALASFSALLEKRLALAAVEFEEQKHRLIDQVVWVAATVVLALMTLIMLSFLVVVLTWDTGARLWAIAAMPVIYGLAAFACGRILMRKLEEAPPAFEATIEEFRKDREWFQEKN